MSDSNLPVENPDDAVLRMLQGASFGKDSKLILPSGKELTSDEAQAFTGAFADEDTCTIRHYSPRRQHGHVDNIDNPLSSANDVHTGDGMLDLAHLIGRANMAVRQTPRRSRPWWKFW